MCVCVCVCVCLPSLFLQRNRIKKEGRESKIQLRVYSRVSRPFIFRAADFFFLKKKSYLTFFISSDRSRKASNVFELNLHVSHLCPSKVGRVS